MCDVSECLRKLQRAREKRRRERIACQRRFKDALQNTSFDRFFTEGQINKMTVNFKNIPTECLMGKVYLANPEEIPFVAIKMLLEVHSGLQKEFSCQMIQH